MHQVLQTVPITRRIPAERQEAKRHYGVHPYFTRRPANVVRAYIKNFTQPGDFVLDPFGGSGVTAIEAMLLNRRGIHNDLNPLANFIASQIADITYEDTTYIRQAFLEVENQCRALVEKVPRMSATEVARRLADVELPENIALPRSSDAERYFDLFSPHQLLALAFLKAGIEQVADPSARGALLLAWSATLGKLNKTFLSARGRLESRGGSSIFSIYRYKIADSPVELPPWEVFRERVTNVLHGKAEVLKQKRLWTRTIAYLDLSVLWNHWLGFTVPLSARQNEIIVGGELRLTEEHYINRLSKSVRLCLDMLKRNGWLSVVFQHWNVRYFEAILESAAEAGASLRAAVTQIGDPIWSMHKKKNKEKVLAGEMILSFIKDGVQESRTTERPSPLSIGELIDETLARVSPDGRPFAGEMLFNQMILRAWNSGALSCLDVSRENFSELLKKKGWRYNSARHQWFNVHDAVLSGLQLTF